MDDSGVRRLCAVAAAEIADARSELLAAAGVEWSGPAADRFGAAVEELLSELVRVSRRLERARELFVATRAEAARGASGASGGGLWKE